ncbi:MAG: hypothetical protein ACLFMZ_05490 [Spirochaetaceae bacterium]
MIRTLCLLSILLFTFSSSFAVSQEILPDITEETDDIHTVDVDVSPNPVGRGDRFTITIEVPVEESDDVEITEPELWDTLSLLGGPNIRPVYESDEDGRRVRKTRITYVFSGKESGRFELGSYKIDSPEGTFTTEPLLIEIGLYRDKNLVIPPDVYWNTSKNRVYVGENVIWILEVAGLKDIRIFEGISFDPPDEGFIEAIDGIGAIVRYSLGGETLYRVPTNEYIYTPSSEGTVNLPSAVVESEGVRVQSDSPDLEVIPLPDDVAENGVVGSFRVTGEVDKESITAGESVKYSVTIEGTGNLNYLRLVEPELEGWTVINEVEEDNYEAGPRGYEGYRRRIYTLSPDTVGDNTIVLPSFTALNPSDDTTYTLGDKENTVQVTVRDTESAEEEEDAFPFTPREVDTASSEPSTPSYRTPEQYLWLLPGPLVFLVFFILRRKKWSVLVGAVLLLSFSSSPTVENAYFEDGMSAYNAGEWEYSYTAFRTFLEENENCADAAYNLALSAYRLERLGEAVYFTRSAIHENPSEREYRELLSFIEENHDLPQIGRFPWAVHPDTLLVFLGLAVNFAGFIGVIYLFTRKNALFILAMLLAVSSIAMSVAFGYSIYTRTMEDAVVITGEAEVKNIPKNNSNTSFVLEEGESVEITGEASPYLFVRTVLGRRGWVRREQLGKVNQNYREIFDLIDSHRGRNGFR